MLIKDSCVLKVLLFIQRRAARNAEGKVIMYADCVTRSMENAITERSVAVKCRWIICKHGIIPKTIKKDIREVIEISTKEETEEKISKQKKMTLGSVRTY
jgi:excinuclease ABC subunit B